MQNSFINAVKTAAPILSQLDKGPEIEKISKQVEKLESEPACILVCGEFKRGKSTFVNALVGRNLCATDYYNDISI